MPDTRHWSELYPIHPPTKEPTPMTHEETVMFLVPKLRELIRVHGESAFSKARSIAIFLEDAAAVDRRYNDDDK